MNTVCLLGGSSFLPEAFAKNIICAGIDLLFRGILYFFTSQVPRGFCVALISVMTGSLSLIKYNGGEKEFLWLLQGISTVFRSWKFSCFFSCCSHRKNWECVCERLSRWGGGGRNECTGPVPCSLSPKVFIAIAINERFYKTVFSRMSSPILFISFSCFFLIPAKLLS